MALGAALVVCWGWGCLLAAQEPPAKENAPTTPGGGGLGGLRGAVSGGGGGLAGLRSAAAAQAEASHTDFEGILRKPTKFDFDTTPLSDVVEFFADQLDINIQLDAKGLTDAAVDSQAPVTRSLRKPIPFESALHLILDEFDLTFAIQHDVLMITSKERADEILTTKVYPVGDLITRRQGWGPLINLITSSIQPDSWGDNGGPASIQPLSVVSSLVIAQRRDVHAEIRDLLAQLRAELPKLPDEAAAKKMTTVIYHLGGPYGAQTSEALKKLVAPESWQGQGGEGMVCVITNGAGNLPAWDVLAIRQAEDVQGQVEDLLFELRYRGMGGGMGAGAAAAPAATAPHGK